MSNLLKLSFPLIWHWMSLAAEEPTPIKQIMLPSLPMGLVSTEYDATTDYHWGYFGELESRDNFEPVDGPFLFGKAIKIFKNKCLIKDMIHNPPEDGCIQDYKLCKKGFSMSVFVKMSYNMSLEMLNSSNFDREYIMSTGGDRTYPGAGIYREGANLGALFSLGSMYWEVNALGFIPMPNVWSNIGIVWNPPKDEPTRFNVNETIFNESHGELELFLDNERIAYTSMGRQSIENDNQTVQNSSKVILGCHWAESERQYKYFSKLDVEYDEPAIWTKGFNEKERFYLSGGYISNLEGFSREKILEFLLNINGSNDNDAKISASIISYFLKERKNRLSDNNATYRSNEPNAIKRDIEFGDIVRVVYRLIDVNNLKSLRTKKRVMFRINLILPLLSVLEGRFGKKWRSNDPQICPNILREKVETYFFRLLKELRGVNLDGNFQLNNDVGSMILSDNYHTWKKIPSLGLLPRYFKFIMGRSFAMQLLQVSNFVMKRRSIFQKDYFIFPQWSIPAWESARKLWKETVEPAEVVQIPIIVYLQDGCSRFNEFTDFVFSVFDKYPDLGKKNPSYFVSNEVRLVSRIISVKTSLFSTNSSKESCQYDSDLLKISPIHITMSHKKFIIESLTYKKFPQKSRIKDYKCAIWNEKIGSFGAWDTEGIQSLFSDNALSNCVAEKFGTYGVLAELYDDIKTPKEETWLKVLKFSGYILSISLLFAYVLTIIIFKYLWEMFHFLNLGISITLIGGHVSMAASEFDLIRKDLLACVVIGCLISFFYLVSAALIFMKSFALFEAVTAGIIGGRTIVYFISSFGSAFLLVGINIFFHFDKMGLDPQCMISPIFESRIAFFLPMIVLASLCVVLMAIITCNLTGLIIKEEHIMDELESTSRGFIAFVCLFALIWLWSPLAYFKSFTDIDFYPAFQIINSFCGTFFFIFGGLGSNRYRSTLYERGTFRNKQINIMAMKLLGQNQRL